MPDSPRSDRSLVLASGNQGKLRELAAMLEPMGWTVRPQSDWDMPEAVEDGLSFVENALIKARHAARLAGLPSLADDSGLVVDALGGAPGIYSARYAGDGGDDANCEKLLDAMRDVPQAERSAHFYCAMALVHHADDPAPLIAIGRWDGFIMRERSGEGGFGYDPLFGVPEKNCTSAELAPEVKNSMSHRGRALQAMCQLMQDDPGS